MTRTMLTLLFIMSAYCCLNICNSFNLRKPKSVYQCYKMCKYDSELDNPDYWNNGEVEWDFKPTNKTVTKKEKDSEIISLSLKDEQVLPAAAASGIINVLYREKLQYDIGFSEVMNFAEGPTSHMNLMDVFLIIYILFIDATYTKTKELETQNIYNQQSVTNMINYIKYKKYIVPLFIVVSSVLAKNVKSVF